MFQIKTHFTLFAAKMSVITFYTHFNTVVKFKRLQLNKELACLLESIHFQILKILYFGIDITLVTPELEYDL